MSKDDHKIRSRLERQIAALLTDVEEHPNTFSWRERLSLVQIVGAYLIRQTKLGDEYNPTGSTIRRYSGAFKTANATSSRARGAGPPVAVYSADDDDGDAA